MDRTLQTVMDMLSQREYKITENSDDKIIAENKEGDKICVFTNIISKFNIDRVKEYISHLHSMELNHCIIIYSGNATPMAKKLVKSSIEIEMEIFKESELQYNVTKHRLVPKHIRLSPEEAERFKKKYGVKVSTMFRSDPVSRFYNYKKGDVIKVIRPNNFIGYRIVKS